MGKHTVIDNFIEQRYEIDLGESMATADYTRAPGIVTLVRTYVPPQHEGEGIAAELMRAVLEDVRAKGLQIVPQCSYTAQYIARHPEWEELVYKK
ncbi:MAG: GNAT family N-acetyltransferase [Alistipes sp.]